MNSMARAVVLGVLLTASAGRADQVIWNEGIQGDISSDRLNPSSVALAFGVNTLIATSQAGDREYISMLVPAGTVLSAINVVSWQSLDTIGFIGVQRGTTFTEPPTGTNVANILGYSHFGPGAGNLGQNILPSIATGAGSQGFTPPLAADTYTFWIQQTSANPATYQLDFVVTAPAPGAGLLVAGLGLLTTRRRRN